MGGNISIKSIMVFCWQLGRLSYEAAPLVSALVQDPLVSEKLALLSFDLVKEIHVTNLRQTVSRTE